MVFNILQPSFIMRTDDLLLLPDNLPNHYNITLNHSYRIKLQITEREEG